HVQRCHPRGALRGRSGRIVPGVHPGGRARHARCSRCLRGREARGKAHQRVRGEEPRSTRPDKVSGMFASTSLNGVIGHAALILGLAACVFGAWGLGIATVTNDRRLLRSIPNYSWMALVAALVAFAI